MTRLRCRSCGGVYETAQDVFTYFHVCPPIPNPAYRPPFQRHPITGEITPNPAYTPDLPEFMLRPDHRDEHPRKDKETIIREGETTVLHAEITSEGRGVEPA